MEPQGYINEMTFRDYLRILFRQKGIILLCGVVVAAVAFVGLTLKTPEYFAQVKLLISAQKQVESPYYQELGSGGQRATATATQSEVVTSRPVLERTVNALRLYDKPLEYEKKFASPLRVRMIDPEIALAKTRIDAMPEEQRNKFLFQRAVAQLRGNVEVLPIRDTNMFTINVGDFDPVQAAIIANVMSRAYVIFDLQQQLAELELKYGTKHPTVLQLKDNIQVMIQNLNGLPLPDEQAIGPASVKIIEQASVPTRPKGAGRNQIFILAGLMGLLLGCILAFIFDYLDQTVKSPRELETALGLAHLGSIPRSRTQRRTLLKDMKSYNAKGAYPASLSALADQVRLLVNGQNVKTILFVEPESTKGFAGIIADLGFSLAGYGDKKVLVVSADYRKNLNGKASPVGLVDILIGKATFEQAVENVATNLWMIPAGKTTLNPITFLDSAKAKDIFQLLKSKFDLVLIEGPDLKSYKDSLAVAANVDGVVLMVSESMTRLPVVRWVLKPLRERKCHVLGAVLNRRKFVIPKFIYDRV